MAVAAILPLAATEGAVQLLNAADEAITIEARLTAPTACVGSRRGPVHFIAAKGGHAARR